MIPVGRGSLGASGWRWVAAGEGGREEEEEEELGASCWALWLLWAPGGLSLPPAQAHPHASASDPRVGVGRQAPQASATLCTGRRLTRVWEVLLFRSAFSGSILRDSGAGHLSLFMSTGPFDMEQGSWGLEGITPAWHPHVQGSPLGGKEPSRPQDSEVAGATPAVGSDRARRTPALPFVAM